MKTLTERLKEKLTGAILIYGAVNNRVPSHDFVKQWCKRLGLKG